MQRLDDVTVRPILPLSATQREQQRVAMISHINGLILQCNELTRKVAELEGATIAHEIRLSALERAAERASARTWWQRVVRF
jgi:hypothetical protein